MTDQSPDTWTSDALQRGEVIAIQQRVVAEPDYIHRRDFVGDTPLLTAIAYGAADLVEFLLEHGSDPNTEVDDGYTCLLSAVESDASRATDIVALLIAAKADIHKAGIHGWSPLHMAAARGQLEKARMLVDAGAGVNQRKQIDGCETPLMEAAYAGQPKLVQLLLEFGADASLCDSVNERTACEIAKDVLAGPDPEVYSYLKSEDFQLNIEEMFADMDLSAEQVEMMKQAADEMDMAENYMQNSESLLESGNHTAVIEILSQLDVPDR